MHSHTRLMEGPTSDLMCTYVGLESGSRVGMRNPLLGSPEESSQEITTLTVIWARPACQPSAEAGAAFFQTCEIFRETGAAETFHVKFTLIHNHM